MEKKLPADSGNMYSGNAARHYHQYLGPVFFEPYAEEIGNRIEHDKVDIALELACGTGRVTRHLRNMLSPGSKLIATDLSPEMMDMAKEFLEGMDIEWQIVDAEQLPFDDNSIDLVVCAFGYMFVPNRVKAFSEAQRVLRPGGKLLFTTWDAIEHNGASFINRTVAKKYLGELPASTLLAVSMNNAEEIRGWLQQAGFSNINIERVNKTAIASSVKEVAVGFSYSGTIYNELMNHNPEWVELVRDEIIKELTEKYGDAPMKGPMRAVFATAVKS
jgi:ubiquinone/menaquinone biosynthesis C-methylase UbiE